MSGTGIVSPPLLKLNYFWDGADWSACGPVLTEHDVGDMVPTKAEIRDALDAFQRRFFPDKEQEDGDSLLKSCLADTEEIFKTWNISHNATESDFTDEIIEAIIEKDPIQRAATASIGHFKGEEFYNRLSESHKLPKNAFARSIAKKLSSAWLLSWHWRAILPYVRDWDKNANFVIQISQVRQWELLLCYTVTDSCAVTDLPSIMRSRDALKNRVTLVRAPLFGVSHRTNRWDMYRLFYRTAFSSELEAYVKNVRGEESDFTAYSHPLALAYVFGRHDCYYKIKDIVGTDSRIEVTVDAHIDLHPQRNPEGMAGVDGKLFTRPYDLLEVPAFRKEQASSVLLASDNYCKALDQLAEVLNDPTARSVLIIAPPGSGKEELAKMAFKCNNRLTAEKRDENKSPTFLSVSLAGLQPDVAQRMLFKLHHPSDLIDHGRLKDDATILPSDGLVFRARYGGLFIDEVDKAPNETRAMLLRFIESRETTIPDDGHFVRLRREEEPQYVFAGSLTRRQMFDLSPPDFWTRISHVVEMAHPLAVGDPGSIKLITKEYTAMFWQQHVPNFLERCGLVNGDLEKFPGKNVYKLVMPYYKALEDFLKSQTIVRFACDTLAEELIGPEQSIPSVRRIRSVVARSVYRATEMLLHNKEPDAPIECLKRRFAVNAGDDSTCSKWFAHLCSVINQVHKGSAEEEAVDLLELRVVDELRQALRQGAVFAS